MPDIVEEQTVEMERRLFPWLIQKPNYFGTMLASSFEPKRRMKHNTRYEEMTCVGFNPQFSRLEAVVVIKREVGYLGGLCSKGTPEYVRFYIDWNNDGTWSDQGMVSFTAHDIPGDKPLEYDVTLQIAPAHKPCVIENLPRVRAILSWYQPPLPGDPDHAPVWGNVLEAHIQIDKPKEFQLRQVLEMAKAEINAELLATVDLTQPLPAAELKALTVPELAKLYEGRDVPEHRFAHAEVQKLIATPLATTALKVPGYLELPPGLKVDIADLIDQLVATTGSTRYEELRCVGLNQNQDTLVGIVTVKLPYGYSGDLCTKGSHEYVAFWERDEIEQMWCYLGTASVSVHDVKSIPPEGLQYAVFLPVDLSRHHRPCTAGPRVLRLRAVLSWETPPPPDQPDKLPTWGNREETLIHVKPGLWVEEGDHTPFISVVGNMGVDEVDSATGLATGTGVMAACVANNSPFGGVIVISGHIAFPPNTFGGGANPLKYKVSVRPCIAGELWQPLSNTITVKLVDQVGSLFIGPYNHTQRIGSDGYYEYMEDLTGNERRFVEGFVLAKWITGAPMTGLWEIKVEAKDPAGKIYEAKNANGKSQVIKVRLDNARPSASIAFTHYERGTDKIVHPITAGTPEECSKFQIGDIIHGTYAVNDEHFNRLTLALEPPEPAAGASVEPDSRAYPTVPTTGEAGTWSLHTGMMHPCGYVLRLWAEDRTIVNSDGIGWEDSAVKGFCVEEAMPGKG